VNIKEIFGKAEEGTLTLAQFEAIAKEAGAKFTDLSEGNYVSKQKYDSDLATKDSAIAELNGNITQRDTDLAELRKQLESAGTDASKLTELQGKFDTLQGQYNSDMENYKQKLADQAYEFAVKEFANSKEFTSQAAKRDFVRSLLNEKLKMKDDSIIGADDFAKSYATDNADAFVIKTEPEQVEAPATGSSASKPQFVSTTPGTAAPKQPSLTDMMRAANERK
jgi:uncharacterized coiled-coil protein SlyX